MQGFIPFCSLPNAVLRSSVGVMAGYRHAHVADREMPDKQGPQKAHSENVQMKADR